MDNTQRTTKVGVTIIGAILMGVIAWLMFSEFQFQGQTYYVYAHFSQALGIKEGLAVKFAGTDIGTVESYDFNNQQRMTSVKIRIKEGTELYTDNRFVIAQDGLLGEKYLEVWEPEDHSPSARTVFEGDVLRGENQASVNDVIDNANRILEEIESFIQSEELRSTIDELIEELRASLHDVTGSMEETLAGVDEMVNGLNGVLSDNAVLINNTMRNVETVSQNFVSMSTNLDSTSAEIAAFVSNPETKAHISNILSQVDEATANVNALTAEINSLVSDPQTQSDLKDTLKYAKEALSESKTTMVKLQETLENADSLINTTEGAVTETADSVKKLTNIGDAVELEMGVSLRTVDADDDHGLSGDDSYVGDINAAIGYDDAYVYVGADEIGEDTNVNLMLGYGSLDGLSFRGGVYRGEMGIGAAYAAEKYKGELMVYDTEDIKVNLTNYIPIMEQLNLIIGAESINNDPVATLGLNYEID
jgi:phospholipid/cholesterol/gamma-HCH transport system substrate-binding protein